MKSQQPTTIDETLLAVAERLDATWRVLLVRRGDRPSVLDSRVFSGSDEAALAGWLSSHRCGDLRVVLPSAATIVRSVTIPTAPQSQMLAALRLQAEGMFLGSVPLVRIGFGVIGQQSETERQGVIMVWPDSQPGVALGGKLESITRYIPEPAALMVLATSDHVAMAADRSVGSIAIAMRCTRPGPKSLEIRATREEAASDSEGDAGWNDGLRRALAETALNAGVETSRIAEFVGLLQDSIERSGDRLLLLDPDVASELSSRLDVQVPAASTDPDWYRSWSIPLAATIVACGSLAELGRMRRLEDRVNPSRIERFVERYSSPARAARVAIAAFAIVALAPVASSWARLAVLEMKIPEKAGAFEESQRDIERRIALYSEVSKRTLPIAKILGDLACCTPDGVEIEQIQITPTQGVTVRGKAKAQGERGAAEIVNTMAAQLDSSGVFEKTSWNWKTPDGRGLFKFELEAPVARPTYRPTVPKERDWAEKTLAERKYPNSDDSAGAGSETASDTVAAADHEQEHTPEAATRNSGGSRNSGGARNAGGTTPNPAALAAALGPKNPVAGAEGESASTPAAESPEATPSRGIGRRPATDSSGGGNAGSLSPAGDGNRPASAASGAGAGGGPGAVAAANLTVPDPFTDEQLAAMSKEQARGLLSEISRARRRNELDAETRKRLSDDFQRILEHLKK